jgi:hypothetical protein
MISEFSSLIELFAAIYLTITVDDLLFRRFWTPDYANKLEKEMEQIKMPALAKRSTIAKASVLSSLEENRSRKRGAIMFGLSVILLAIIGFEEYFKPLGDIGQSGLLALLIFVVLVIYFLDESLLKSWWSVLLSVVFVPLLIGTAAIVLPYLTGYEAVANKSRNGYILVARLFLVGSLVLPVVWQLLRNWIYSRYYLSYIIEQTKDKAKDYNDALRYDHTKQKVKDVAIEYHEAVLQAVAAGAGDRQITPFLYILKENLAKIEYVPSLFPLLKYSYRSYRKNHITNSRLKKLYNKYKTILPAPKMEKFCYDEGISFEKFKSYHLKQIGKG